MSSFSRCSLPSDQPLPGETGAALRSAPEPTTGCTGLRLRFGRRSSCAAAQSHDNLNRTVFRTLSLVGLRDVAEASNESLAQTETVIGTDDRVRISPASSYPWRVNCALRITAKDGSLWIGTAFFISPRVLATAGHCVFINGKNQARNGWVRSIDVMPGRDDDNLPFGMETSTRSCSVRGWAEYGDDEWDYGAIILANPLGNQTGWLGFGTYRDATLKKRIGNISGYPGNPGNGTQQWYMARRISSVGARKVFYDIDTLEGQSGSAVYRIRNGSRYAFAIHAYGVGANRLNSATRINRSVFDNLSSWKKAHP